jgi:ubiquitin-protein ligase
MRERAALSTSSSNAVPQTPTPASLGGRVDAWRVRIEAPLSSRPAAEIVLWPLYVVLPPDYPYACPVVRFVPSPRIPHVEATGRVICSAFLEYHPRTAVADLLAAVRSLFAQADDYGWTASTPCEKLKRREPAPEPTDTPRVGFSIPSSRAAASRPEPPTARTASSSPKTRSTGRDTRSQV